MERLGFLLPPAHRALVDAQIPVRQIVYPEGTEHLPRVADAILDAEA
jgi:hypothetical protein